MEGVPCADTLSFCSVINSMQTRDCKVDMSNEVLPFISNEVVDLFAQFDGNILADVLRLWDCDAQDWKDDTTMVFRFEDEDLLVWKESTMLCARIGAVETAFMDDSISKTLGEILPNEECLSWRIDRGYDVLIGRRGVASQLLARLARVFAKPEELPSS